jgi:hypothetical protein
MKSVCKLCKLNPPIQNSHVIPEFMYKPVYDPKHRFVPISTSDFQPPKIEQKGFREPILCPACETKFSQWEGALKTTLNAIYTRNPKVLAAENGEVLVLKSIDGNMLRIGILSILWRLIVSEGDDFKFYQASAEVTEDLRAILNSNNINLPDDKYPILVSLIERSDGINAQDILMLFDGSGDYFGLPRLSFIAYGFLFDVALGIKLIPGKIFAVNSTSELVLRKTLIDDIMKQHSAIDIHESINKLAKKHYNL